MNKTVMLLALILIFAAGTHAAKKYVAVLEAVVDAQPDAYMEIRKPELNSITEELRRVAASSLPPDRYSVMTKETIQAQESAVLQECAAENCIIKMGAAIGADYIVKSGIRKFGPKFMLTVEMYETKNGTLAAVLPEPVRSETLYEILEKATSVCEEMYKKFLNAQSAGTQPQPQPPPAPTPQPQPPYQPPAPVPTPTNKRPNVDGSGILTDGRDGKKYKTAVIGGKRWMSENLDYQTSSGSWCYDNDDSNCDKYGRLYDWKTAKSACPFGMHLPSRQEWGNLAKAAGGTGTYGGDGGTAGNRLKATTGWYNKGNGTDSYGFSALPGGVRDDNDDFYDAGNYSYWWTATEKDSYFTYVRGMHYNRDRAGEDAYDRSYGLSVRCLDD
jgi:uncharacterized protein (TIGR02145 family)